MTALPPAKADVGSAINGTARNLGSVLGIAVIGSIVTSAYKAALAPGHAVAGIPLIARLSVGAASGDHDRRCPRAGGRGWRRAGPRPTDRPGNRVGLR